MDDSRRIIQRPQPKLEGEIPRYWLGGDPFRTRFFDAMSMTFPEGERFFIGSVREYRDRITDPQLAAQVRDFIHQEGQHGMAHTQFNDRLRAQGIDVDRIQQKVRDKVAGFRRDFSPAFNLGKTAGAEHLTAMMAHGFFATGLLKDADPRVRAMYAWHAVEEIEHKAVAFDVFERVAKGGYWTRVLSMLHTSLSFPVHVLLIMRHMLKADGASGWGTWLRGLWWLYGPGGLYGRLMPHYLAYFRRDFHPWKHGEMDTYRRWLEAYERSGGDPVAAGDATVARTT
ncbi:MAG: metal-dependent hydrolase [Gammaproteobacteria bacterium]